MKINNNKFMTINNNKFILLPKSEIFHNLTYLKYLMLHLWKEIVISCTSAIASMTYSFKDNIIFGKFSSAAKKTSKYIFFYFLGKKTNFTQDILSPVIKI